MAGMPLDPMTYIGLVSRDEEGVVRNLKVIYPEETVHLEGGEEFITFTTNVLLENLGKEA